MQQKALGQENRNKDIKYSHKSNRYNVNYVDNDSDGASSENETSEVCTAEFIWPNQA